MSATTRSSSPSLASLSDTSDSVVDNISPADVLSGERSDALATVRDDATADTDETQDSRFFKGEGLVTLIVEGTPYRVHEYLLTKHSSYWARELNEKKRLDERIELEGVNTCDMDALMNILYHESFQEYDLAEIQEWQSVLRLATKWEFATIRGLAIDKLEPLATPLQKLVMARAFGVTSWLQPALVALCVRKEPLTLKEGKQLPIEDVIVINATREATRQKTQTVADEGEVSAHIAKHVLLAETVPSITSGPTLSLPEITQTVHMTAPSPSPAPSTPTPSIATAPASANSPPVVQPPVLSATPSSDELSYLITALLEPDFDLAVSLVASDNVQVFVDALNTFTKICKEPTLSVKLMDAVLRRSSKEASFLPIGIQLICALPKDTKVKIPCYHHMNFGNFFQHRGLSSMRAHRRIMGIRTRIGNTDFSLRYGAVDSPTQDADYMLYLGILGGETLATSVYDERSANLRSFYKRLMESGMMDSVSLQ